MDVRLVAKALACAVAMLGVAFLGSVTTQAGNGGERKGETSATPIMIVPSDLYEFVESMGCAQVSDFYNSSPGVRHPPYIYGLVGDPTQDSAAVVCERNELGRRTFLLVLKFDDSQPEFRGCSHEITGLNLHGGISLDASAEPSLSRLYQVGNGEIVGPDPSKPFIRVEYETATILYCHEGKWLFRSYD